MKMDKSSLLTKRYSGLILIILIGLFLRLIHIKSPLLDNFRWRQTDTAAIARNFYNNGFNILHPQIDWGGREGFVETEFQIYPFMVAILYKIFGVHDVLGRIVSVIFSLFSMVFLFKLTQNLFTTNAAYYATLFFALSPLNIFYSRTFMPEAAMIFFTICAVYFYSQWLIREKRYLLLIAGVSTSLACLIKPTSLYIGLPLLYITYQKYGIKLLRERSTYIFLAVSLIPVVLWYSHAYSIFKEYHNTFGILAGGFNKFSNLTILSNPNFYRIILRRLIFLILTIPGTLFVLLGLLVEINDKKKHFLYIWAIGIIMYIFLVAKGNQIHDYYQLPIVPLAAILFGIGVDYVGRKKLLDEISINHISSKTLNILLIGLLPLVLLRYDNFANMYKISSTLPSVVERIQKVVKKDDLLIIGKCTKGEIAPFFNGWPVLLYHAHRKGWVINKDKYSAQYIELYRKKGAKYFATTQMDVFNGSELANYLKNNYQVVESDEHYIIISL